MKTAISSPDELFEEAERPVTIPGWSRSKLHPNAVSAFVNNENFLGVRQNLDAVYGKNTDGSAAEPLPANAQAGSILKKKW